jgi:hypothetical protein
LKKENAISLIENYLKQFGIIKVNDDNLKHNKMYFVDEKGEKYLFYCAYYDDFNILNESWRLMQDEDIAFYLQGNKFARKDIRWDTYFIILYGNEKGMKEDTYINIERNRFCCKKLIFCAETEEILINELKSKLPFTTADYYPDNDLCLISNEEFIDELRKIALLDENVFTYDLFDDVLRNSSKWLKLLQQRNEG